MQKFQTTTAITISTKGCFSKLQGAFYIVYDTECYDYESASRILKKYVDDLPVY